VRPWGQVQRFVHVAWFLTDYLWVKVDAQPMGGTGIPVENGNARMSGKYPISD